MSKKALPLKISFLGDSAAINKFIAEYTNGITPKEEMKKNILVKKMTKTIGADEFKISMFQINEIEKGFKLDADCVVIIFDMTKREAFEKLLDYWILWLRDTIKFQGFTIILGDYNKGEMLMTDQSEISELIDVSELADMKFIDIGCLDKQMKIEKLDEFLIDANKKAIKNNKGCLVF